MPRMTYGLRATMDEFLMTAANSRGVSTLKEKRSSPDCGLQLDYMKPECSLVIADRGEYVRVLAHRRHTPRVCNAGSGGLTF